MSKTIIVNNGSVSKKYALYENNKELFKIHYEKTPVDFIITEVKDGEEKEEQIYPNVFEDSFSDLIDRLLKHDLILYEDDIDAVSLRIVAPGKFFQKHRLIDKKYLLELDDIYELSPLHIGPVKKEISEIIERLPKVKMLAISDSAFHNTMSETAQSYSFPEKMTKKLDLYRFGYHGLSVSSVIRILDKKDSSLDKIIVCHLGGGSSITAVKNNKSVDTSMGFSPIEGVPMATRAGTADPNALISIIESENMSTDELQDFLYKKCGLKGISGTSGDTRVILAKAHKGDKKAELALDVYAYQIAKTISSYYIVLGGIDAIVFTGTIGERSAEVRKRICEKLSIFGAELDNGENKTSIKGGNSINSVDSKIKVEIIPTAEVDEMAQVTNKFLK